MSIKKYILPSCLVVLFFFIDQISKQYMHEYSGQLGSIFTYVINTQAARNISFPLPFLIMTAIIVVVVCGYFYVKGYMPRWSFICMVAGALGNLYDRIVLGGVRDWINIRIIPVFNMADILITLGVILFIFAEYNKTRGNH